MYIGLPQEAMPEPGFLASQIAIVQESSNINPLWPFCSYRGTAMPCPTVDPYGASFNNVYAPDFN
jgi:hypothetical protein